MSYLWKSSSYPPLSPSSPDLTLAAAVASLWWSEHSSYLSLLILQCKSCTHSDFHTSRKLLSYRANSMLFTFTINGKALNKQTTTNLPRESTTTSQCTVSIIMHMQYTVTPHHFQKLLAQVLTMLTHVKHQYHDNYTHPCSKEMCKGVYCQGFFFFYRACS